MNTDLIGYGFVFLVFACLVSYFLFTRFRLSKQEKDFVSYVQNEARALKITKEKLHGFLVGNIDRLELFYCMEKGSLVLKNVPKVLNMIESTYKPV